MSAESGPESPASIGEPTDWEAEIASIRVLFGRNRLGDAGKIVQSLGRRRVVLVSDPGIRAAGHLGRLQSALGAAGLEVFTFTDVGENPDAAQVEAGAQFARAKDPDCVVALGGGSAMDCAKGINFLLANGGRISDYWGFGLATRPLLPAVGIPTTAGTGSEAQSFALITGTDSRRKMACGDPSARFQRVVLDPELLSSVPSDVAAATGLDAVGHALESLVSTRRNPVSQMLSRQAWSLLHGSLEASLHKDATPEIRGRVLLGAHLAGAAIEQSMLGAAHACANPLTAAFGIPHGLAVALMLPHVVRFNGDIAASEFMELSGIAQLGTSESNAEAVAHRVEEMRQNVGLPDSLHQLKVPQSALPDLATAAQNEWTAGFNPRPVSQAQFEALYESAY